MFPRHEKKQKHKHKIDMNYVQKKNEQNKMYFTVQPLQ